MAPDDKYSTALPLAFLEAFPFPVLVFKTYPKARPPFPSRGTVESVLSSHSGTPSISGRLSRPLWTNEKWSALAEGRELEECLDQAGRQKLANWIERDVVLHDQERMQELLDDSDEQTSSWGRRGSDMPTFSTSDAPTGLSTGRAQHDRLDKLSKQVCITLSFSKPIDVTLEFTKMSIPVLSATSSLPSYYKVVYTTPVSSFPEYALPSSPGPAAQAESYMSHRSSVDVDSLYSGGGFLSPGQHSHGDAASVDHGWARISNASSDRPARADSFRYAALPPLLEDPAMIPQMALDPSLDCKALLINKDWSKTSLGPMSQWPHGLNLVISVMLATPDQASIWLGDDLCCLYNQRYSEIVAGHGPDTYGKPMKELWSNVWEDLGSTMESAYRGRSVYRINEEIMMIDPNTGLLMEAYHTWRATPIIDDDGRIIGCWNYTNDNTDRVIGDRRTMTLREMSARTSFSRTKAKFHEAVMEVLEMNEREAPFALLYSAEHDVDAVLINSGKEESILTTSRLTLVQSIGVPANHHSAPDELEIMLPKASTRTHLSNTANRISSPTLSAISALSTSSHRPAANSDTAEAGSWPFKKVLLTKRCVLVKDLSQLIEGYQPRVFGTLPQAAILIPICSDSATDLPSTILIVGLHPRAPLDTDYEDWILDLRSQLAAALITAEAREMETAAAEATARLERAKTAFFRNASHELSTPLALLAGPTQDLLRVVKNPTQKKLLLMMQRNFSRLQRLISSLMDFSRLEAGNMQATFIPVNVAEFTEELSDLFQAAMDKAKLKFMFERRDADDRMLFIDPNLWEKIIFNLIGNALKHTQAGFVRVAVSHTEEYAEILIEDSGIGVSPEDISRITERFHRASNSGRSFGGTGIGFTLAVELVKLHGGSLSITSWAPEQSLDDHGTQVLIRMPWGYAHLPRSEVNPDGAVNSFGGYGKGLVEEAMQWIDSSRDAESKGSVTSFEEASDAGTAGEKKNLDASTFYFEKTDVILIADDNRDMRYYIRSIFEPFCKCVEAEDGLEALELAIASPPQLIISDVMMAKMDGLELLASVKGHDATRYTPVILVSAVSGDDVRVESLLNGADDFLMKPFRPRDLLARGHLHLQLGKRRQSLELAFERRSMEMKILADYSPTGIIRTNMYGHIEYANAAWKALLGFDETSDLDSWDQQLPAETRQDLRDAWEDVVNGSSESKELTWKWLNGRTMTGHFIRLDLKATGLSGVLGCVTDISHQEELLNIAEDRRKEAEESKRQQELLIDLTSHEIRTPVSAILQMRWQQCEENLLELREAFVKLGPQEPFYVKDTLVKEMAADIEALESIHQCGLVQERIAGDVLSMARIQLDMLQICDIKTDVLAEARKVFSVFTSEAKTKDIKLSLTFGDSFEQLGVQYVMADPTRLGQVLSNLISNAIRFTASSDIRHIAVSYEIAHFPPSEDNCLPPAVKGSRATPGDPLYLYVTVKDSGPGLAPIELALLFQRFSQSNKMIHTRYGGSGLGLFICRKITELMNGRIEVASRFGEGSSFRFFIKTEAASLDVDYAEGPDIHGMAQQAITAVKQDVAQAEKGKMYVLIVEDNVINQTVLKRQLLKAGLTCEVANHGEDALDLLRVSQMPGAPDDQRFDCVLMDLEMPVMDGFEAVKQIRLDEEAGVMERSLVIALTGNARQGQIDEALSCGMDEVVIKPYKLPQLLTTMETMMERLQGAKRAGIEEQFVRN